MKNQTAASPMLNGANIHENLPVLGAALRIDELQEHTDWLIEEQRDLEIQDAINTTLLEESWSSTVGKARAALMGFTGRIGIHGPFVDFSIAARDRWLREYAIKRLTQALHFGQELGASHMVIHSPFTYFGDPFTPYGTPQSVQEMIGRVQATLEPVLVVAESAETILVIETIFDRNPQPLVEVVRSFDSPNVKLSIDTGHCYITHRLGGASPDAWIDAAGDLVHHLHIQDTDGLADRHWAPGVGAINWVALFRALNKLESNPRMILELRDKASIMGVCGWLSEKGLAR